MVLHHLSNRIIILYRLWRHNTYRYLWLQSSLLRSFRLHDSRLLCSCRYLNSQTLRHSAFILLSVADLRHRDILCNLIRLDPSSFRANPSHNTCLSNCTHHYWYSCFSRLWSIQTMIQKLQLLKPQLLQTDVEGSKQFSSCRCTFNTLIPTSVHLSFGKLLVANNRIEIRTSHILILLLLNTTTKTLGSDFLPWGIVLRFISSFPTVGVQM